MAKSTEGIVRKRLSDYLSKQYLLTKQKFGFPENRSTALAATIFTDDTQKHVDNKSLVGCEFIDISKAFDTISHAKLLAKSSLSYGGNGVELEWFKSCLLNRQQVSYYNNYTSIQNSVGFLKARSWALSFSYCSQMTKPMLLKTPTS